MEVIILYFFPGFFFFINLDNISIFGNNEENQPLIGFDLDDFRDNKVFWKNEIFAAYES